MSIVCISREFGAGGKTLSENVARRLGYEAVDEELVFRVAKEVGASIDHLESAAKELGLKHGHFVSGLVNTGILERFFGLAPSGLQEGKLPVVFKKLIPEFAERGNVVFLGRGSQFVVPDSHETLKVLLVAKFEDRLKFMMENYQMDELQARKSIREMENNRLSFLRRFTQESPNDPGLYDVSINMSLLSLDAAENLICNAVEDKKATLHRHRPIWEIDF